VLRPAKLVFLDETWATTALTRTRGRCPRGERLFCPVPHGRWRTTTFLCALRADGLVAPLVLDGAIDGPAFLAWIEQMLAPTLRPGEPRQPQGRRRARGDRGARGLAALPAALQSGSESRSVPVRTFGDWRDPAPGWVEADFVSHGGTVVSGAFAQTLVLTDVATGWTACIPVVVREAEMVIHALRRARELFPFPLRGVDFDNDGLFMNDLVVGWCRAEGLDVTRSRAYRKNDQAWVEQKNGAVVRRLVGYGRFEGVLAGEALGRLYAAARLHGNLFQPSFKLREKRREGARVVKRYHVPEPPAARVLAHAAVSDADKARLRAVLADADPVLLLAAIRAAQAELGKRVDERGTGLARADEPEPIDLARFAARLRTAWAEGERRPTHRRLCGSSRWCGRRCWTRCATRCSPGWKRNRRCRQSMRLSDCASCIPTGLGLTTCARCSGS
jgi:hypothetical protein